MVISCSTFYINLITGTGNELGRIAGWKTLLEGGMIIAERNVVVGKPTCRSERVNQILVNRSVGGIVVSIAAFQAVDPGSIPGQRIFVDFMLFFICLKLYKI